MLKHRLAVFHFLPVRRRAAARRLPAERVLDDRVDELVHGRQVRPHLIAHDLEQRPRAQVAAADRRVLERHLERVHEPVRGVHRARTGGARGVRGRVGQRRVERAHVLAEEELGRAVHREARDEVLPVDGDALLHARGHLLQHVVRMSGMGAMST